MQLNSVFASAISKLEEWNLKTSQIVGPAGTGKTTCIYIFGKALEQEAKKQKVNLQHVYVNLKLQGGSRVVLYRHLLETVAPEVASMGLSAEEMLRQLVRYLTKNQRYLLISLDELDYWLKSTKETSVIYDLSRLNEIDLGKPCNVFAVIFSARSTDFHAKLDPAEISTLGRVPLYFKPYSAKQIFDILLDRVPLAFRPGAVADEVIEYVADIAASPPSNGDVRYALDLLTYSGNLAENQGADKVSPEHVRTVHGQLHPTITEDDILSLPRKEHLHTLLAVARALKGRQRGYASLREIREEATFLQEERKVKGLAEQLEELLQDLSDRGIVEIRSLLEIGMSGVPAEKLQRFLDTLLRRLEAET